MRIARSGIECPGMTRTSGTTRLEHVAYCAQRLRVRARIFSMAITLIYIE